MDIRPGYVELNGDIRRGAHEPVIDEATWARYQAVRRDNRRKGRKAASVYLLSGLLRCECGATMTGARSGDGRAQYKCSAVVASRAHTGGYVSARIVEGKVLEWLAGVADQIDAAVDALTPDPMVTADRTLIESQIVDIDRKLARLTEAYLSGVVTEAAQRATQDALETRRTGLVAALADLSDRAAIAAQQPARETCGLLVDWDTLAVTARRAALRALIDHVTVTMGAERGVVVHAL